MLRLGTVVMIAVVAAACAKRGPAPEEFPPWTEAGFATKATPAYTIPTPVKGKPAPVSVIGEMRTYTIRDGDTLMDVARWFDLGFNEIVKDRDSWYSGGANNPIVKRMDQYVDTYDLYYLTVFVDTSGRVIAVNSKDQDGKPVAFQSLPIADRARTMAAFLDEVQQIVGADLSEAQVLRRLQDIGTRLYDLLLPEDMQAYLWKHRDQQTWVVVLEGKIASSRPPGLIYRQLVLQLDAETGEFMEGTTRNPPEEVAATSLPAITPARGPLPVLPTRVRPTTVPGKPKTDPGAPARPTPGPGTPTMTPDPR